MMVWFTLLLHFGWVLCKWFYNLVLVARIDMGGCMYGYNVCGLCEPILWVGSTRIWVQSPFQSPSWSSWSSFLQFFFKKFFQFILKAFDLVWVYVAKVMFMNNQNCGKLNYNFHHFPCTSIYQSPCNFSLKMFHQHTLSCDLED